MNDACGKSDGSLREVTPLRLSTVVLSALRDRIAALPRWKQPYELMPGHPLEVA